MSIASLLIALKARLAARPFLQAVQDPRASQERLLRGILERNKDTEYGRRFGFARIRDAAEFRREVPVIDYEDIRPLVDRITRGETNVLTSENPVMFAQTSGTTGEPKYIPVTPTCRKNGGTSTWMHFARRDHPDMFAGKLITIVSPAVEGHTPAGIPYGSTSGMVVRELPGVVRKTFAVPYETYEISDYAAEYETILRFGLAEDVSLLGTANPSSILMLAGTADRRAEALIRGIHDGTLDPALDIEPALRRSLESRLRADPARARELDGMRRARGGRLLPADYWPHLALIGCWKAGTVGTYIERFPEWFAPDGGAMPAVRDMGYLASEARMSVPVSDHGAGGVLTVHLNYFEFVPAGEVMERPDDPASWSVLGAHELEIGDEYNVIVTTTGGLYRYDMNDVVEVVDRWQGTPVVTFRRKGRGMTNLTGEKVCVNHLIEAVNRASESTGVDVLHFRAEPDAGESRYVFKVEAGRAPPEDEAARLLRAIDEEIGRCNVEWRAKRASGRLRDPLLHVMRSGWYERGRKRVVAEGRRQFQSKTILLDAASEYQPEPGETEFEVTFRTGGGSVRSREPEDS